jgi:hypothetical protein
MSFHDNWEPNIVVTVGWDLLKVTCLFALRWVLRHWSTVRDALAAALTTCVELCRRLAPFGRRPGDLVPPAGTAGAVATAMQPLPQYMNTSTMQQWEAYQRQHDLQARFAMASAMRGLPPALLSPPSNAHPGSAHITPPSGSIVFGR